MEKIRYSDTDLSIYRLDGEDFKSLSTFSCGVESLDSFFHKEIELCARYRYITPYCVKLNNEIVAVFTLSNDSIMLEEEDKKDFPNVQGEYRSIFPLQSSFPAVNIGHLGVRRDLQSHGIGEMAVRYVWHTFSLFNTSGCQFITVDALNNPRTNKFYTRLGFEYQSIHDHCCPTRRMYLDIFTTI